MAGSHEIRPPAGGPPPPEESTVHLSVPAVLLTVVYAAALAVAVSAPGQHLVAGLVVLTGRPGLGAPPATDGYRPAAALDRFTRARDRRCRFPGCRRRIPKAGELDHVERYPDGPTAAANLAGFCTADHHRGKHQAPGWSYALAPDGTLTVTTPSGLVAVTDPPPY